jgi:5-hydroxyisourate hydrolase-like protein (transthyretin family)
MKVGDLDPEKPMRINKGGKLNWEGPYCIHAKLGGGAYMLKMMKGKYCSELGISSTSDFITVVTISQHREKKLLRRGRRM